MSSPYKGRQGFTRLVYATRSSWSGLRQAYRRESAFRQEVWLAVLMAPNAGWLGRTGLERFALLACLLLVLIVELLNSGIEAAVDRISFEHHELSGLAKDYASAAVFVSLVLCGGAWSAALARAVWP